MTQTALERAADREQPRMRGESLDRQCQLPPHNFSKRSHQGQGARRGLRAGGEGEGQPEGQEFLG